MRERHRETLRSVVTTFAPADARVDRITELAAAAIDGLTPRRRAELLMLLALLRLPMRAGDAAREAALNALARAPVAKLRTGFAALKRLALFLAYAESEPGSENPTWKRIGYPGPRGDGRAGAAALPLAVASDGEIVRADVVVIGSGAGGATAASSFARAGKRVVVLEAGGAYDAASFTQREISMADLYLDRGLTSSSDLGIAILAGATLGGGTAVNWCTSLRLPERIAAEWQEQSGIERLGAELEAHYAAVEARLSIAPALTHNANNAVIVEGARALGMDAEATPRNASPECGAGCGYCGFGCSYEKKHCGVAVFLPDLAASGGAIYANAAAQRITMRGSRARGAIALQTGASGFARFEVEAACVVVAAGALRTPQLLARSGVRHPLLGRRLFLHPVSSAIAEFDRRIEPWNGPMQSAHSDAFNYRTGNYGTKIEAAPAHPGLAALALPWTSRAEHAEMMERMPNVATLLALTRDRDPGRVGLDDEASIEYRLSAHDGENLLAGLRGLVDLAFAAGAVRVTTLHATPIAVEAAQWTPRFRDEFAARLRRIGVAPNRQILFSAHQMGTAAMGSGRVRGVVDPAGCVWECENLLVADGSLFPQSSGVNPMLTIMAMASRVAAQNGGA